LAPMGVISAHEPIGSPAEPSRISMCHCLECQRRTGAAISNQARFRREQVTFAGNSTAWMRTAKSGNALTFHFCPTCGSTVYWEGEGFPGYVAVAIGNFADPKFPAPTIAVWEESRHPAMEENKSAGSRSPRFSRRLKISAVLLFRLPCRRPGERVCPGWNVIPIWH